MEMCEKIYQIDDNTKLTPPHQPPKEPRRHRHNPRNPHPPHQSRQRRLQGHRRRRHSRQAPQGGRPALQDRPGLSRGRVSRKRKRGARSILRACRGACGGLSEHDCCVVGEQVLQFGLEGRAGCCEPNHVGEYQCGFGDWGGVDEHGGWWGV